MVLPWLVTEWRETHPDAWEAFRERAAIIEVDGRIPRARAEAAAEECVRREWRARTDLGAIVVPKAVRSRNH